MNISIPIDKRYIYENLTSNEILKGIVHICHGKGEHIGRYSWLIDRLNNDGYHVISIDHRGHGRWVQNKHQKGVFAEENGWEVITQDLNNLILDTSYKYPNLDQYLFAHSMGSWVGLNLAMNKVNIKGLIISGSSKFPFFLMLAQKFVIKFSSFFFGKYSTNAILDYMTDVTWNKKFKPNKTTHDWISSDPDNVENYVKDELCGFSVTNSMWNDIAYGCTKAFDKKNYKNCNINLPILLIAGTNDPVSNFGKGMNALNELLGQVFINIKHIKIKNDRHEVYSGLNKELAYDHLKSFIDTA